MPHTVLTFLHVQMVFRRTQQFSRSQRGNPFKNEIGTHEQTTMWPGLNKLKRDIIVPMATVVFR